MRILHFSIFLAALLVTLGVQAQTTSKVLTDVKITTSKAIKLGHVSSIKEAQKKESTSKEKKKRSKAFKQVPDNFKGRRGFSKSIYKAIEHQGPDPLRQFKFNNSAKIVEPIVNIDGIGDNKSPHDPSGDVSDQFYVQMINHTSVAVYDLAGNLISEFDANTLWNQFTQSSAGDPIVLYDENEDRWLLTEFADPANILIAVSDDGDPLGGYTAFNFSTPNFPDYPKYGLSPNILTLTTNEEGASNLHNYFLDLKALYDGNDEIDLQRIEVGGNNATEAGFYVTTPVDWNGTQLPFDSRPIALNLNDSSWPGGPAQDQIEIYTFDIDFEEPGNSQVIQSSIPTVPFDAFPCSQSGFQFACIPQRSGSGLDGVPEVIMNIPHLRNFGTHESMVFSFITDATNGENVSGIRWIELRRSSALEEWALFQEGTFAPDDGLDRFMPSIAMDGKGNIGLAYNVSSSESFVGARFTGRVPTDPLGEMTVKEYVIVEGKDAISSNERFGDYSQMSVAPNGDDTFWWTSEYAGLGSAVTQTRIVAFKINKDTFDLSLQSIDSPLTGAELTASEQVIVTILNSGLKTIDNYRLDLLFRNEVIESIDISESLTPESTKQVTFETLLDLSDIDIYSIGAAVVAPKDQNMLNDTLSIFIRQLHSLEAGIDGKIQQGNCTSTTAADILVTNNGANPISSIAFGVTVNDSIVDTLFYNGSISYTQSAKIEYDVVNLPAGENTVKFAIISINGQSEDGVPENDEIILTTTNLPADHFITLEFLTDDYPGESSWELLAQGSNVLIASGEFNDPATLTNQTICVDPDSCYVFVLKDSQGDGICCGFGQGNFSIYDNQGNLVAANDGDFTSIVAENFCATGMACALDISTSVTDASAINNEDGVILIEVSSGIEPYEFSIDGENFQGNPTFTGLAPGEYLITIRDDSGLCEMTASVSVGFTSSIVDVIGNKVDVQLSPNPTQAIFKIVIENLQVEEYLLPIQILNLSGQVIEERQIGKYNDQFIGTFSLMDYADGVYLVKIAHPAFHFMSKVIKLSEPE